MYFWLCQVHICSICSYCFAIKTWCKTFVCNSMLNKPLSESESESVYSTVYSGADHRKHQISASLAFVEGIHRRPVNSPYKWPITREMFLFYDVIMEIQGGDCWGRVWVPLCVLIATRDIMGFDAQARSSVNGSTGFNSGAHWPLNGTLSTLLIHCILLKGEGVDHRGVLINVALFRPFSV